MEHLLECEDLLYDLIDLGIGEPRVKFVVQYKGFNGKKYEYLLPGLDEVMGKITPKMVWEEIAEEGIEDPEPDKLTLNNLTARRIERNNYLRGGKSNEDSFKEFTRSYIEDRGETQTFYILIDGKLAASNSNN